MEEKIENIDKVIEYWKDSSDQNYKFKTMANQSVIETAKQYLSMIPNDLGVRKAYLFGSYAKGNEREDSDIDIAIILQNMPDFFLLKNY